MATLPMIPISGHVVHTDDHPREGKVWHCQLCGRMWTYGVAVTGLAADCVPRAIVGDAPAASETV